MILPCPYCGPRNSSEFTYRGDAAPRRPDARADEAAFGDYVYVRDNPAGLFREYWHHSAGCRAWIVVTRDTRSHAVLEARPATEAGR